MNSGGQVRLDRMRRAIAAMKADSDTRWRAVADWIDFHRLDLVQAGGRITACESIGDVQQAYGVATAYLREDGA